MNNMTILLDVDGVLSDFFGSALRLLNKNYPDRALTEDQYREDPTFNMDKKFGITAGQFWQVIESEFGFWENLDPYPWSKKLYTFLQGYGDVTISTSPSNDPYCLMEKAIWLKRHLNIGIDQCMFGSRKYLMANSNTVLIDDRPENVEKFRKAGGRAILLPSTWNTSNLNFEKLKKIIAENII